MENLSAILEPYQQTLGWLASTAAVVQYFSGAVLCKDIYYNQSTYGISPTPFVGGLITAIIMLKYALLLHNYTLLTVYTVSTTLHALYTMVYNYYSCDKVNDVYKPLSYGCAVITALYSYASWEDPKVVQARFGFIVTFLILALISSPLLELHEIIATKDASRIPVPVTLIGSIGSIFWILYGISLRDTYMVVQNVVALFLWSIQMGLCVKYPKEEIQSLN
ncbi:hypothetical protein RN001_012794 [Aquatica leii]|uniref:Sugar transporter SWEET n=1 Tax=Aquatica leii TaxID=1421715 RepID=A0AAN7P4F0_9COLE|nr:hypothetical protein RN001_012794 [Aquatica leii]